MNAATFVIDSYELDPGKALTEAITEAHASLALEPGLKARLDTARLTADDAPDSVQWRIEVTLRTFTPYLEEQTPA